MDALRARWQTTTRIGTRLYMAVLGLAAVCLLVLLPATGARAQTGALTTIFAQNNSFAGNTFDLEVRRPGAVAIKRLDVNLSNPGTAAQIGVWTRPGTAVGFEESSTGWTPRGVVAVTSAGIDNPTPVPLSPILLPQGSYGVAVGVTDYPSVSMQYTNGAATTFEDAALRLTSGRGLGNPLFSAGQSFADRIWNGTIRYEVRRARLGLQVKPRRRTVGARRKVVAYRFRATNKSGFASGPVRLCATAPRKRVRIGGTRCVVRQNIPAGETRARRVEARIKKAARGKVTRIKLIARGTGVETRQTAARLRVKR